MPEQCCASSTNDVEVMTDLSLTETTRSVATTLPRSAATRLMVKPSQPGSCIAPGSPSPSTTSMTWSAGYKTASSHYQSLT